MAVERNDLGDTPLTITGLFSGGDPWTFTGWVKRKGDASTFSTFWQMQTGAGSPYILIGEDNTGNDFKVFDGGSAEAVIFDDPMVQDTWYFFAISYAADGTTNAWWKEDGDGSLTQVMTDQALGDHAAVENLTVGESSAGSGDWFQGSLMALRAWDVVLTQGEIETEMNEATQQKTSDTVGDWRFKNVDSGWQNDSSAASNDLTGGTGWIDDTDEPTDLDVVAANVLLFVRRGRSRVS